MPIVHFPNDLQTYTNGLEELDIAAPRVHELFLALAERFPGMGEELERVAVAIDGDIYNDSPYQPLRPGSVIYLVPKIVGG